MKRFRGSSDPRYAEIQEQGCRALNAISKGEELIKNYLADRQEELQVMEAIAEAMARCASPALSSLATHFLIQI